MTGQVAFLGAHLMDAPRNELIQTHEGMEDQPAGVGVVGGGRVHRLPLPHKEFAGACFECFVRAHHEVWGRDVFPCPRGRMEHQGEPGKAITEGNGQVGQGVDGEMFPHRRGGNWGFPIEW